MHSLFFFLKGCAFFDGFNSPTDIVRKQQFTAVAQRSAVNHLAASLAYQGLAFVAQDYAFLAHPVENLAPFDSKNFTHRIDGFARILAQPFVGAVKQFIFLLQTLGANWLIEAREKRTAPFAVTQ
jgi:hypothetical protein